MSGYYGQRQSYHTFAPRQRITWAVQRLILANVIVFAAQLVLHMVLLPELPLPSGGAPPGNALVRHLAFQPPQFLAGFVWKPFTYMFLHADLLHLFSNMLWLFIFGPEVERILGTRQFLRFYVLCGAVAVMGTLLPYFLNPANAPSVVGASGATMAVLVAFAMADPDRQFFLFPLPIPITARALVIIVIALNLISALPGNSPVSVATHIGGMLIGYAYMKWTPAIRRFFDRMHGRPAVRKKGIDAVGEAVDNIFEFENEKRRRK